MPFKVSQPFFLIPIFESGGGGWQVHWYFLQALLFQFLQTQIKFKIGREIIWLFRVEINSRGKKDGAGTIVLMIMTGNTKLVFITFQMRTTSNQNYACLEWKWWALRENPTAFNFSQWHTFWQLVTVPKFQTRSKIVVLWSILCSTRGRKFSSSSFTLCREKSQIEVKQDGTQKQTNKKKNPPHFLNH